MLKCMRRSASRRPSRACGPASITAATSMPAASSQSPSPTRSSPAPSKTACHSPYYDASQRNPGLLFSVRETEAVDRTTRAARESLSYGGAHRRRSLAGQLFRFSWLYPYRRPDMPFGGLFPFLRRQTFRVLKPSLMHRVQQFLVGRRSIQSLGKLASRDPVRVHPLDRVATDPRWVPEPLRIRAGHLLGEIFQPEAVIPALDVPDRGRGKVHRAAQRIGVAVALEKPPPRR